MSFIEGWNNRCYTQKTKGFTPNNPKITQSSSDSQLFIGKNVFLEKKLIFLWIKQLTSILVQTLKTCFLQNLAGNFLLFWLFVQKTLKMTISTSVWSAQQPNTGRNIQHPGVRFSDAFYNEVVHELSVKSYFEMHLKNLNKRQLV